MFTRRFGPFAAALLLLFGWAGTGRADIMLTYGAAGAQASTANNITVESFNGFSTGSYSSLSTAVGNVTGPSGVSINTANEYGGAGGTGNYIAPNGNSTSTITLTLTSSQTYFGFWWSAADSTNYVYFYDGSNLVATFDPTTALSALPASYYGNPNSNFPNQNNDQAYAFINAFATAGTVITSVVFQSSEFESDNWTISDNPGGMSGTPFSATPEPASLTMLGFGALGLMGYGWRRKRNAQINTARGQK